jgi:hypothetical protein
MDEHTVIIRSIFYKNMDIPARLKKLKKKGGGEIRDCGVAAQDYAAIKRILHFSPIPRKYWQ